MKKVMYSVYDSKSDSFLRPVISDTKGDAIRSFIEEAGDPKSTIGKYPEDFNLFYLGTFDMSNGIIDPLVPVLEKTGMEALAIYKDRCMRGDLVNQESIAVA